MNPSYDKELLLDMQEHPERYSDQQLEQAMAELDKEPDTEAAWQLLNEELRMKNEESLAETTAVANSSLFTLHSSFRRIAAVFLAFALLGLMSLAGYRVFSDWHKAPQAPVQADTTAVEVHRFYYDVLDGDTIFRFENVRLDSILTIVGRHYDRQIVFKDKTLRSLRLYITCHTSRKLDEFVETLNVFDGVSLSQNFDTLFVRSDEAKEGMR